MNNNNIAVLRVGNYPTTFFNKAGYHAYMLSGLAKEYHTYYVSAKLKGQPLPLENNNSSVKRFDFFLKEFSSTTGKMNRFLFMLKRVLSIVIFSIKTIVFASNKNIKIVHIHSPMYSPIALWGKMMGKKVFITFHGEDFNRIKNSSLYRRGAFLFDGVFAISPNMIDGLNKIHGESKVQQVFNGIDTNTYKNLNMERLNQIICVGSFKKVKGHRLLIDAFAEFNKKHENYNLALVGEGELKEELQAYCEKLNLSNILFPGHLGTDEIVKFYNQSKALVLTSFSEGFPKVILEGLSSGCAIVATTVGSIPQIFGEDYPLLLKERDPLKLAELLCKVVQEPKIMAPYLSIPQTYKWSSVINLYLNKYKEAVNVS